MSTQCKTLIKNSIQIFQTWCTAMLWRYKDLGVDARLKLLLSYCIVYFNIKLMSKVIMSYLSYCLLN